MPFVPINGDHAIQTVSFNITFSRPLTQADLQAVRAGHKKWRAELPAIASPRGFEMQLDSSGGSPKTVAFPGLEFSFLRPDGTPAWTLRLLGADATVDCNRYTRWAKTWDRASRYLSEALQLLGKSGEDRNIVSLTLIVLDRFRAEDTNDSIHGLFKKSQFLAAEMFEVGPIWHQHMGWYKVAEQDRILNQVNIDAKAEMLNVQDDETKQCLVVSLQHVQQWQIKTPLSIQSQLTRVIEVLETSMHAMHRENKNLLANLINEHMLDRIGFFVTEAQA